ncbi:hypothetical protein BaRGS_00012952 [Batillaria attramentaria]|uniref:Arrestin C-terminal-like domain-containing protein n=1 Tax=Batillaria attramentaria TaxID=370345 RepID=A0ABD0L9B2_9CAEN
MSAVEELTIVLEHDIDEQYQYQPGEIVRGNIVVKTVRPTAIRNITIRVVGEGNVSWKDEDDHSICQAEETYCDASKVILDTRQLEPRNLQPGLHEFPFEYQLSDNLPSSYIGKFGNVTYTMKATVLGVKSIDTSISSEPFLVLRRCPLPPSVEQPLVLAQEKRLWGSCTFGKISARLTLERRGGVPGEDLFMHAEIKNHSQRTVTAMQASLIMMSIYLARNRSTTFRQIVSKKRDEFDVEHNEGRRWNYVRLTLPPYIPETRLEHCDIIEIEYFFQFRVEISGGVELKMEAPIMIGAHPQGLEVPGAGFGPAAGGERNSQWTIRTKGLPVDMTEEGTGADLGDPQHHWGVATGVPELRGDKVVVNNPLFRQGSFMTKGVKAIPEEHMENTRL